jgi:hypothetical protein
MKIECTPQEFRQLVSLFGPQEVLPKGVQISSGRPDPDSIPRIQVYAPPEKMDAAVENLDTEHPVDRIPVDEQKGLKTAVQQKLNEVSQPAGLQQDLTSSVTEAPGDKLEEVEAAERNTVPAPEPPAAEPAAPQATEEPSKPEAPQAAAEEPTEAEQKAENGKRIRELIIKASTISSPTEAVEVVKTAGSVESVKDLKPEQAPAVIAALQDFIANQGGKA